MHLLTSADPVMIICSILWRLGALLLLSTVSASVVLLTWNVGLCRNICPAAFWFVIETKKNKYAGSERLQALHALQACLYSPAVSGMTSLHHLRDQTLALVFRLSWSAKRAVKLADSYVKLSSVQEEEDDSSDEVSDAAVEIGITDGDAAADISLDAQVCCACHQSCTLFVHFLACRRSID